MVQRGVKMVNGRPTRYAHQSAEEVKAILDVNSIISNDRSRPGGMGSDNVRYLARIPMAQVGAWGHEWRMKGGLQGTGMKLNEYCLLKASTPNFNKFVVSPSGRTGFEKQARRLAFSRVDGRATGITTDKKNTKPRSQTVTMKQGTCNDPTVKKVIV